MEEGRWVASLAARSADSLPMEGRSRLPVWDLMCRRRVWGVSEGGDGAEDARCFMAEQIARM